MSVCHHHVQNPHHLLVNEHLKHCSHSHSMPILHRRGTQNHLSKTVYEEVPFSSNEGTLVIIRSATRGKMKSLKPPFVFMGTSTCSQASFLKRKSYLPPRPIRHRGMRASVMNSEGSRNFTKLGVSYLSLATA